MKQHWHVNPLPPPESVSDGRDGFTSFVLIVFAIIGPLIYFGSELRMVEVWLVDAYRTIDGWAAPIRDWFMG
jgi:hypothetical protein